MTKRRLLRWLLLLVTLAAFAIWLEPTRVVWGWLRGEAFYQGRPTSWWARQLLVWEHFEFYWGRRWGGDEVPKAWHFKYKPTQVDQWLHDFCKTAEPDFPAILKAAPDTRPILEELAICSDLQVSEVARERLRGTKMYHFKIRIHGGVTP